MNQTLPDPTLAARFFFRNHNGRNKNLLNIRTRAPAECLPEEEPQTAEPKNENTQGAEHIAGGGKMIEGEV